MALLSSGSSGQKNNRKAKALVWGSIFIQTSFPLCLSFTPIMVASATDIPVKTQSYQLKDGETVHLIAERYGLTLNELKQLNRNRVFFYALTVGDTIDVPLNPAKPITQQIVSETRQSSQVITPIQEMPVGTAGKTETELANYAVNSAKLLSANNTENAALSMARSAATQQVGQEAQDFLTQFGTARVQLNVDDKMRLEGSSLDVLVPLYDGKENVLFTQLGARHKDSRNTLNMGLGARTFQSDWMFGVNTFYDNDLTGRNKRLGLGAEAWTDYMKLSANNYIGLTNWHQSRDFADYDERPANGFDVRAEAYLPAYPALGGKLMYEQYRGREVALFGKDDRQKNPYAMTAGVNYTPIPLVTVGVEQRMGKGGHSDSSVNLTFNYRLGESWSSQTDTSQVNAMRTLAGSRLDLVERNNQIVLDYKKQELIRLALPENISGQEGSQAAVNAQVTAKYGLANIVWDSAALVAAGGAVTQTSSESLSITLPPYNPTRATNTYTVSAIAYDTHGNASSRATTDITVIPAPVPTETLIAANDFTVNSGALANGSATNALMAIVKDAKGNVVPNVEVTFTVTNGSATPATQTATTNAQGVASAGLVSLVAGDNQVTASVGTYTTQAKVAAFVADMSTANITDADFTVASGAQANGTEANALTAIVKDANGNLVAGADVTFTVTSGSATPATQTVQTDAQGVATASIVSLVAGGNQVTASVGTNTTQAKTSTFVADGTSAVIAENDFTVTSGAAANGVATNTLTATVKDAQGNVVPNTAVTFTVTDGSATPATQTVQTNAQGVATANLVSLVAGGNQVTASVGANTTQAKTSSFVPDDTSAVIAENDFTVTSGAVANGIATNTLAATVKDAQGNIVIGADVTFIVTNGSATPAAQTVQTNAQGIATANLVSLVAGDNLVTASVGANTTAAKTSSFVPDNTTANIAENDFTVTSGAAANGVATNTLTATVKDAQGNVVPNTSVTFTVTDGSATPATQTVQTNAQGVATANLVSLVAGDNQVTASVGSNTTAAKTSIFVADETSANIAENDFTVTSGAAANGVATNTLTATVKDAQGNVVPNATVTFTVTGGSATPATQTVQTNAQGIATANLVSLVAGDNQVTASVGSNTTAAKVSTFIADIDTAIIADNEFIVTSGALADGNDPNSLSAQVRDANGNVVAGVNVVFTVISGDATPSTQTVQTDAQGIARAELVSGVVGGNQVTATVGANTTAAKTSSFVDVPAFNQIKTGQHNWAINIGYPTTAFAGANFILDANGAQTDYTWSSSEPATVTVSATGVVSFVEKPSGPVTITATPTGGGSPISYTINLSHWFIKAPSVMTFSQAQTYCDNNGGEVPISSLMASGKWAYKLGSLMGEWMQHQNIISGPTWSYYMSGSVLTRQIISTNGEGNHPSQVPSETVQYPTVCAQPM